MNERQIKRGCKNNNMSVLITKHANRKQPFPDYTFTRTFVSIACSIYMSIKVNFFSIYDSAYFNDC